MALKKSGVLGAPVGSVIVSGPAVASTLRDLVLRQSAGRGGLDDVGDRAGIRLRLRS